MTMYLVRRYEDCLPDGEYGVNDGYYAVGLFSNEAIANVVKQQEEAKQHEHETEFDIVTIEVNRIYNKEHQIFLGGGFYIE